MNNKGFGIPKKLVVITLFGTMLLCGGKALAQTPSTPHVTVGGSVFGGGNLAPVSGNSSVTLNQPGTVIGTMEDDGEGHQVLKASTGDVYGGGALANVGTDNSNTTTVDILDGNVYGNVYGGGLGRKEERDGENNVTVTAIEAVVRGIVTVNIGEDNGDGTYDGDATIRGSVYGCNNTNGSPKDNVFVNIYKTARTAKQAASYTNTDREYELSQVFGGGNQAAYLPSTTGKKTTVQIWTCENTIVYV